MTAGPVGGDDWDVLGGAELESLVGELGGELGDVLVRVGLGAALDEGGAEWDVAGELGSAGAEVGERPGPAAPAGGAARKTPATVAAAIAAPATERTAGIRAEPGAVRDVMTAMKPQMCRRTRHLPPGHPDGFAFKHLGG